MPSTTRVAETSPMHRSGSIDLNQCTAMSPGRISCMSKSQPGVTTIDVRPDFFYGHEPFRRIMRAVAKLKPGEKLLLLAPFEPLPLCRIMAGRGYSYTASELPSGSWEVLFEQDETAGAPCDDRPPADLDWLTIDVRGLEPPMPLVRVLEALETLPGRSGLIVHTDRRPMLLLEELPRRGFVAVSNLASDGESYVTRIERA